MKPFNNYDVVLRSLFVAGTLAVTLSACTKGAQDNRRLSQNGAPLGATNVAPNGINNTPNNLPACNVNDPNPADLASPNNPQSTCTIRNNSANAPVPAVNNQQGAGPFSNQNNPQGGGPFADGQQQIGPNGQQQYVNNNGQIIAPNYGMPPSSNDIDTTEGVAGRIVKKQFQLDHGQALQTAKDTCALNDENIDALSKSGGMTVDGRIHTYQWGRTLIPAGSRPALAIQQVDRNFIPDRFDLFFDPNGLLTVSAQSEIGNASSTVKLSPIDYDSSTNQPDGTYSLDPETKTLRIGSFEMYGPIADPLKQHERLIAAILKHQNDINQYEKLDLSGPLPEDSNQDYSGSSNQQTFVIGHSTNNAQATAAGANYSFRPQALGKPHLTSPDYLTLKVQEIEARMYLLLPANPQHITGLQIDNIKIEGTTYVDTTKGPDLCSGKAQITYIDTFLK